MNTCDTCKFWEPPVYVSGHVRGECNHKKLADWDSPDGCVASDSEFGAPLTTGPKFGCVHHEPKEPHGA